MKASKCIVFLCAASALLHFVAAVGFNNFQFPGTNTVYGDHLNQVIHIHGEYHNIVYKSLNASQQQNVTYKTALDLANAFKTKIYVCNVQTPKVLVELSSSKAAKIFKDNIKTLTQGKGVGDMMDPIDFSLNGCRLLFGTSTLTDVKYVVTNTFMHYHPVLFIDPFGYGSFNYLLKRIVDKNEDEGTPIRYCAGNSYSGQLYSIGKRPICPNPLQKKNGEHQNGRITLYKTNIVAINHKVYWCTQTKTHINSGKRFFGSTWDNRPLIGIHSAPSEHSCKEWIKTKNTPFGPLKKVEDGSSAQNSYATNNDKSFRYPWCGSNTRDVYDAYIIEATMTIEMPSLKITTPFGTIPTNMLYNSTHVLGNRGRLFWEPFQHKDVCTHVPYASAEGFSIKYDHDSKTVAKSKNDKVQYVKYFVSDKLSMFESVDNTNLVKSDVEYNCISREDGSEMYSLGNEGLLKFHPGSVNLPGVTYHPHASFNKIRTTADGSILSTDLVNSHTSHDASGAHNTMTIVSPAPINSTTLISQSQNALDPADQANKFIAAVQKVATGSSSSGSATPTEVSDYNQYMEQKTQRENNERISYEFCKSKQNDYDEMARNIVVNPTRVLTQKLKRGLEAKYAGTNYYNVKMCDRVSNIRVVPTLFTNSSVGVHIDGKLTPVNNLVKKLGVTPSNLTCLAGVLVVFNVGDARQQSGNVQKDYFGQVDAEGIIRTDRARLLEACSRNSMTDDEKIFAIQETSYVFLNYVQKYQLNHKMFDEESIEHHIKAQETLAAGNSSTPQYGKLDEIRNNIHFINVDPPKMLDDYDFYPIGSTGQSLYSIPELQSLSLGLSEVIAEQAYEKNFDNVVNNMIVTDYVDNSTSSVDFGNIVSSVADGVGDLLGDGADALSTVLNGGADAVGKLVHSGTQAIGSLADTSTGVFSGVAGTLSGTISDLFVPIICIGGLVLVCGVVGFIIYKKWMTGSFDKAKKKRKRKYSSGSESESESGSESEEETSNENEKKKVAV